MMTEELLIHELARRAGISIRTIRYYIEEGLLPQPTYEGKYSKFTLNYLERLELIRRLKDSYLPLREIREIMSSLSDAQVKLRLRQLPPSTPKISPPESPDQTGPKPGAKALDYINRVMEDQTKFKTMGSPKEPHIDRSDKMGRILPPFPSMQFQSTASGEEAWLRISLAPGVELHLRQPMDAETQKRVQQLLNTSRKIFHEKP